MKKLLAMLLAAAMIVSLGVAAAADTWEDEHDYSDFFSIDDGISAVTPGRNYYLPCYWSNEEMTDEFFENYKVSVTVTSDDDEISGLKAKERIEKAEFIKGPGGAYYFWIRAKASSNYFKDMAICIGVIAKDLTNDDYRDKEELYFYIDNSRALSPEDEDEEAIDEREYDVGTYEHKLVFHDDCDSCRLNFDDGSYYNAQFVKNRKFALGYTDEVDAMLQMANAGADLKMLDFIYRPTFDTSSLLKVYAPGMKYLYQWNPDNTLTLLSDEINDGYFGTVTATLGCYVASDRELTAPEGAAFAPSASSGRSSRGSSGLSGLISANFSNQFSVISYQGSYGQIGQTVTLRASGVDLSHLNAALLRLYAYDEVNNKLILLPDAGAYIGTDGNFYFSTAVTGQYVITDSALTYK